MTWERSVYKRCRSEKHFSEFLPIRRRQKSAARTKTDEPIEMPHEASGTKWRRCHAVYRMGCSLAPPGWYDWTIGAQRRCGLANKIGRHLSRWRAPLPTGRTTCSQRSGRQVKIWKFRHGISIVERAVDLARESSEAQSVINWTVVGRLSW